MTQAEQHCASLLDERQHHRTQGHAAMTGPRTAFQDLQSYLYRPLSVTYPVIAETTTLLERLRTLRSRVAHQLPA